MCVICSAPFCRPQHYWSSLKAATWLWSHTCVPFSVSTWSSGAPSPAGPLTIWPGCVGRPTGSPDWVQPEFRSSCSVSLSCLPRKHWGVSSPPSRTRPMISLPADEGGKALPWGLEKMTPSPGEPILPPEDRKASEHRYSVMGLNPNFGWTKHHFNFILEI